MQDSGQIARMRSLNWVFVVRSSVWFLLFSWRESYQKFTVLLFATTNWATIITMVFERFKSCFSICSINWFKVKWNLQVCKIVIFDGGVSCLAFNLVVQSWKNSAYIIALEQTAPPEQAINWVHESA